MGVEFRLGELLKEFHLDDLQSRQELMKSLGVTRQLFGRMCRNEVPQITFVHLNKICTWLIEKEVPWDLLPSALFSIEQTTLWDKIARCENVTIYLGEYQYTDAGGIINRWLSRRDAAVASIAVQQLSIRSQNWKSSPVILYEYLPYSFSVDTDQINEKLLQDDLKILDSARKKLQIPSQSCSALLVGSQRINRLLEVYIADLFGCRPFKQAVGKGSVPFFSVYRKKVRYMPSCFGGRENPFRKQDKNKTGLHYVDGRRWVTLPWKRNIHDAGVVVVEQNPKTNTVALAIFGFTGRATEAIGEQLVKKQEKFWPPNTTVRGRNIGIYICKLTYKPLSSEEEAVGKVGLTSCEVIELKESTLQNYLRKD